MGLVIALHLYIGWVFMLGSFFLAAWAYRCYRRHVPLSARFWRVQRGGMHLLGLQVVVGLVLWLGFHAHLPTKLHLMYAVLAMLAVLAQLLLHPDRSLGRMIREEGTFNESGAFALLTLLAGLFALRLLMTGLGMP